MLFRAIVLLLIFNWPCLAEDYPSRIFLDDGWLVANVVSPEGDHLIADSLLATDSLLLRADDQKHYVILKRQFKHPKPAKNERVFLNIGDARFSVSLYVNGKSVFFGKSSGGLIRAEVTDCLSGDDEIILVIQDWTAAFENVDLKAAGGSIAESKTQSANYEYAVSSPFDRSLWRKAILPMGSDYKSFGVAGKIWLEVVEDFVVSGLNVRPVNGLKGLNISGQFATLGREKAGEIDEPCEIEIFDFNSGDTVFRSEGRLSGKDVRFEINLDATGLGPWEPEEPKLYRLKMGFPNHRYSMETVFGHRTFQTEGHRFLLNGKRLNLNTGSIMSNRLTRDQLVERIRGLKQLNINAVRFHGQYFPQWYYQVCDELGMMVIAESAIYGSFVIQYDFMSDAFWENAKQHWLGLVQKLSRHPSVVAYSIENESVEYSHGEEIQRRFAELGRLVKRLDPTRPVLFNGGGDPDGGADIVSLHYPHELPFWNHYPDDAWWLKGAVDSRPGFFNPDPAAFCGYGTYIDTFWYRQPGFCWTWTRDKPLDIGEIGYPLGGEPHMDAVLIGDGAYAEPFSKVRDRSQAIIWKETVSAARALDVALINPWNPPGGPLASAALTAANRPVRVIWHPAAVKSRFFSGEEALWPFTVVNNGRRPIDARVRFTLTDTGGHRRISGQSGLLAIDPGEGRAAAINLVLPAVAHEAAFVLKWALVDAASGELIGDFGEKPVTLLPAPIAAYPWQTLQPVQLIDPVGQTRRLFVQTGVPHRAVSDLTGAVAEGAVLVIGQGAFTQMDGPALQALKARLEDEGATTIILSQDIYPPGLAPGLTLNRRHGATIGFAGRTSHPFLAGIPESGLRYWGNDRRMTHMSLNMPLAGYQPVVLSGGTGGLRYVSLLSKEKQSGRDVFCQLPLIDEFATEPMAARLLYNLLRHLPQAGARGLRSVLMEPALLAALQNGGVNVALHPQPESGLSLTAAAGEPVGDGRASRDLSASPSKAASQASDAAPDILILDAYNPILNGSDPAKVLASIRNGAALWLTGLKPEAAPLIKALYPGVMVRAFDEGKLPLRRNRGFDPARGILNQDLYWTALPSVAISHPVKLKPHSQWALTGLKNGKGLRWQVIGDPAVMAAVKIGKGWLLIDTIDWGAWLPSAGQAGDGVRKTTFNSNNEKALRLFTGILANLGARVGPVAGGLRLEAEDMAVKTPGQPAVRNREHHYWQIFQNNLISDRFWIHDLPTTPPKYDVRVKAACRAVIEENPRMRVEIDGVVIGDLVVSDSEWAVYHFNTDIGPGEHEVRVVLANNPDDAYNLRYLHVDWVDIAPVTAN